MSGTPSQFSSNPLQSSSGPVGDPGEQVSVTTPLEHVNVPVAAQTPMPHEVLVWTKLSSGMPLQFSSMLLQLSSNPVGEPSIQESVSTPSIHSRSPVEAQTPRPQFVTVATYSSSVTSLQLLSIPSQTSSAAPG